MHSSTIASMPWVPESERQRSSFASRVSGFFGHRNGQTTSYQSPRATTTFEVPLFLSPTRYTPRREYNTSDIESGFKEPSTPEIECDTERNPHTDETTSSVYSSPIHCPSSGSSSNLPTQTGTEISTVSQSSSRPAQRRTKKRQVRRKRQRKVSIKRQLQTAKHLSLAFGITFLLAVVTYLVLAATGIASGTIFHVILILLLLVLFGVFFHSACRWFMLSRRRKERRRQKAQRGHWFGQTDRDEERGDCAEWNGALFAEHAPQNPIQIIMKEDEIVGRDVEPSLGGNVQHPPPVYGNFRESKRINPSLVHWKKVPPSPLTPTYAEAMSDVQQVVGYRPPSYIESDSGATRIVDTQRVDVEGAMQSIHPLHRHSAGH